MFDKEYLKKKFSEEHERFYNVELFDREGFVRKVCTECGKGFWTADADKTSCGDSSHTPYSFIREKARPMGYAEFWKKFAEFWSSRGHAVIPRYPTLSRWRDDLYFTIASIVDFQRLENGKTVFEYPANPLIVPQICLRFNDIANVGVTGRHFSGFMMAGQHSFDCDRAGYWKNECLHYNFEFLTQVLEVPKNEITYGEDVWSLPDYSSFGPCSESFANGSELVNSVFTEFRRGPNDSIEPLDMKVIDVGWGFERLLWYYTGAASAYDATFPRELAYMRTRSSLELPQELFDRYSRLAATLDVETTHNFAEEKHKIAQSLGIPLDSLEKTIAPLQAIYAIADHSRTLLFALSDGALPSNAAGGYNLRVLARRAYSFLDEYPFDFSLTDIMKLHAEDLKPLFPELSENLDDIHEILEEEKRKYNESKTTARATATQVISRGKPLTVKEMSTLYESQGVTAELLEQVATKLDKQIEIPTEFYRLLTDKHVMAEKAAKVAPLPIDDLPPTRTLYYDFPQKTEEVATILRIHENKIVLDRTLFYPEGGGQVSDTGTLGGVRVLRADKIGGMVIHTVENASPLSVGSAVKLVIDGARRQAIMRHHSATHVMIQTARRVLGNHVWQCGSRKDEHEAHVDLTHFKKLSREEKNEIERRANEIVRASLPISMKEMERGEAEKRYGFRLYQGGGAIGKRLRIVEIEDYDVQACGGTHVPKTSDIGTLVITHVEGIQDGVVRLHYKAGPAAIEWMEEQEELMERAGAFLSVPASELPATVARVFEEWKERGKEIEKLSHTLAQTLSREMIRGAREKNETLVKADGLPHSDKFVETLALLIGEEPGMAACLTNSNGFVVCTAFPGSAFKANELLAGTNAKGGGSEKFARGKLR